MNTKSINTVLCSPVFMVAIVLLIVNDHYLKVAYPGILSGKLSDIAGLFAFPLFIAAFVPSTKRWVYALTGAAFVVWKLPFFDNVISAFNSFLPVRIGRTIDYSDYCALLVLPLSYFYKPHQTRLASGRFACLAIATISFVAFCATGGTHGHIKFYHYHTSKYQLQKYIDSVFALHPEISMPKGDTIYRQERDPYFKCDIIDSVGPEIMTVRYYGDESMWQGHPDSATIFLVNAGIYGQDLKVEAELSEEEKQRIVKKFEDGFIEKLNYYIRPSSSDDGE